MKRNIIYKMLILKLITDTYQSKGNRSDYSMLREFERTIPPNKIEIIPRSRNENNETRAENDSSFEIVPFNLR